MTEPTVIGAYLVLFFLIGFIFLLVNLLLGWLVRPNNPSPEKKEIYECGEPAIGSSFVQFDLRFYVIALVFIVFDAEVAFLFPVATVFGKATNLMGTPDEVVGTAADGSLALSNAADGVYRELGVASPNLAASVNVESATADVQHLAFQLGWTAFAAIHVFFIVLLIGFAYEWQTGSLDWIRAAKKERAASQGSRAGPNAAERQRAMSA